MQNWKEFEGKNVYVKLNSDRIYQGKILEVEFMGYDDSGVVWCLITMKDKFNCYVSFSNKEIKFIESEPER